MAGQPVFQVMSRQPCQEETYQRNILLHVLLASFRYFKVCGHLMSAWEIGYILQRPGEITLTLFDPMPLRAKLGCSILCQSEPNSVENRPSNLMLLNIGHVGLGFDHVPATSAGFPESRQQCPETGQCREDAPELPRPRRRRRRRNAEHHSLYGKYVQPQYIDFSDAPDISAEQ